MSKKSALILFTFFDIWACYILWTSCQTIHQIFVAISNSSDSLSFQNRAGIPVLMITIPIIHIFLIFEYFRPQLVKKGTAILNKIAIIFAIFLFVIAIFISFYLPNYVEKAGYQYCDGASERLTFSTFLVYTQNEKICKQLVENNKSRNEKR